MGCVVNVHAAKTHLSRLIDRAAEGEEIIIARGGKPVARLAALEADRKTRRPGLGRGRTLERSISACGFGELPVTARHAATVRNLPPHHGDPFDRLLVAQALTEDLRIVTADDVFALYGAAVLAAEDRAWHSSASVGPV